MITDSFVYNVHNMFNELRIRTNSIPSYSKFYERVIDTLNKCITSTDAGVCLTYFNYCDKHWDKIEKIFEKKSKLEFWNYLEFTKPKEIEIFENEEEALGSYFITNAFDKNYKNISLTSLTFDNEVYDLGKIGKDFEIGNYKLDFSFWSSMKAKIVDKTGRTICIVKYDDKSGTIYLKDNLTKYDLVYKEHIIGIIDRRDKLNNNLSYDKIIADIDWDIINENSEFGVALIVLYKEISDEDFDLIMSIAITTFTLFTRYIKNIQTTTSLLMLNNALNNL